MAFTDVLKFWFEELTQKQWFAKNADLDAQIKERFGAIHQAATSGEFKNWRSKPEGRLAEIIVLDQFSRNIFRDDAKAFAFDSLALSLAQEAVRVGDDQKIPIPRRSFLYMPFMHSESKPVHELALKLFSTLGLEYNLKFELAHKEIIERFGRYPHRNKVLGRTSTPEEVEFLKRSGSGF